jgi:hypothetical protein
MWAVKLLIVCVLGVAAAKKFKDGDRVELIANNVWIISLVARVCVLPTLLFVRGVERRFACCVAGVRWGPLRTLRRRIATTPCRFAGPSPLKSTPRSWARCWRAIGA